MLRVQHVHSFFGKSENFHPGNLQRQICSCIGTPLLGAQGLPTICSLRHPYASITHAPESPSHINISDPVTKLQFPSQSIGTPLQRCQDQVQTRFEQDLGPLNPMSDAPTLPFHWKLACPGVNTPRTSQKDPSQQIPTGAATMQWHPWRLSRRRACSLKWVDEKSSERCGHGMSHLPAGTWWLKRSCKPANQQTHKPASKKPRTQETKHNTARHKGVLPVSLLIHCQTAIERTEKKLATADSTIPGPRPGGLSWTTQVVNAKKGYRNLQPSKVRVILSGLLSRSVCHAVLISDRNETIIPAITPYKTMSTVWMRRLRTH